MSAMTSTPPSGQESFGCQQSRDGFNSVQSHILVEIVNCIFTAARGSTESGRSGYSISGKDENLERMKTRPENDGVSPCASPSRVSQVHVHGKHPFSWRTVDRPA